jgi:alpha-glucosidase
VIAVFNLGDVAVEVDLPAAAEAVQLEGYGLPGTQAGARISLPAYGGWFGELR